MESNAGFIEESAAGLNSLLAANPTEATPGPPEMTYALLLLAGIVILLIWLARFFQSGHHDPLQNAPVRRNRLPGWFPFIQIFIWLSVAAGITLLVEKLYTGKNEAIKEVISYGILGIWDLFLLALLLTIGWFGFARGLKGMGLAPRTIPRDIPLAFLTLLAALPLIEVSLRITMILGHLFDFDLEKHPSLMSLETYPQWWMQAIIILFAILIAPVLEELLFRGFLQSTLTGMLENPWISILITSGIFAIFHPITHVPALFVLSVVLGYSYEKSGSLFRPILIHIYFNSLSVLVTLLTLQSPS